MIAIDILLLWSKEVSLQIKASSRQRLAMSIENGMHKISHASGVLCVETHTAPLERKGLFVWLL